MSKITVLEIHPLRRPRVKQISTYEPLLERELGGLIEVKTPLEDNQNIALICNAESAIQGQSMNRAIYSSADHKQLEEIILGTFFVAQIADEGKFESLTNEQLEFYTNRFLLPEYFGINSTGQVNVCKFENDEDLFCKDEDEDTGQIIRNIWDGQNCPRSQMIEQDEYRILMKRVCKAMNSLNCVLPESMDELFEKYIEAEHDLLKWCEKDAFAKGISIGKKLAATQ